MVHRALTSVLMVRNCGREAWTIQFDHGICEKVDNCNSTILAHKFSHLDIVHWVSFFPLTTSESSEENDSIYLLGFFIASLQIR